MVKNMESKYKLILTRESETRHCQKKKKGKKVADFFILLSFS